MLLEWRIYVYAYHQFCIPDGNKMLDLHWKMVDVCVCVSSYVLRMMEELHAGRVVCLQEKKQIKR